MPRANTTKNPDTRVFSDKRYTIAQLGRCNICTFVAVPNSDDGHGNVLFELKYRSMLCTERH